MAPYLGHSIGAREDELSHSLSQLNLVEDRTKNPKRPRIGLARHGGILPSSQYSQAKVGRS